MSTQVKKIRAPKPQAATLTPSEVADKIGVHRASLYRWIDRGVFPAPTVKVGRTVRWPLAVVDRWIAEGVRA